MATGRVLIVEDDPAISRAYGRFLSASGQDVHLATDGEQALLRLREARFDVVLSDIWMPKVSGLGLLQSIRQADQDVSVVLMSGAPSIETATEAMELRAFRYLSKPIPSETLCEVVAEAVGVCFTARRTREAMETAAKVERDRETRNALQIRFARAVEQLWMAYQPVVRWSTRSVLAYEALARTREETMRNPMVLFDAATALGETIKIGRAVRTITSTAALGEETLLFVNVLPSDLLDEELYLSASPLSARASRTVLEVTERASLESIGGLPERLAALRKMGFRIALDDMGEGYAGLSSFALLEPEIMKLDMSLIRGIDGSQMKRHLVHSMVTLGAGLGTLVLAEGVETEGELKALVDLGCDYFQGYLFGRPGALPADVAWPSALAS